MTSITDRYATAVRAKNLKSDPESMHDATNPVATACAADVLAAHGLAAKQQRLAMALARLLVGDRLVVREIVEILADKAGDKAVAEGVEMNRHEAKDTAQKVLAWVVHGTCKPCGGLGHPTIKGTTTLAGSHCTACYGSGRIAFDMHFSALHLYVARWLRDEVESGIAQAGAEARKALAPMRP